MNITYIGRIQSPFTTREAMPIQSVNASDALGQVIIDQQYMEGLTDLEQFSHIILIYHFHQITTVQMKVTPFLDTIERGIFSTRAPVRPNPIGLSVVRLLQVTGNILTIQGIDVIDSTPVLDIKPYVPQFDIVTSANSGWFSQSRDQLRKIQSDDRYK